MKITQKKNPNYILWGLLAVLVILVLWAIGSYNGLVRSDETVNERWANVETQYQRRADLIPNLVATVEKYTDYEGDLLRDVTAARSGWMQAAQSGDINAEVAAAQNMDSAIARLLVTVEAYPNLKASDNFLSLQDELAGTENRVSYSRTEFNAAVKDYNTKVRRFPSNILAGMFGFDRRTPFEAQEGAENAPNVGELFNN
jgi:LemA protein